MLKKHFTALIIFSQLFLGLLTPVALAVVNPDTTSFPVSTYLTADGQDQKYLKTKDGKVKAPIASFIIQVINLLVLGIGSLCFLSLVIGGFVLLISHGNENLVSKGKDIIKYALIGLVVVLSAYFITSYVQSLLYENP